MIEGAIDVVIPVRNGAATIVSAIQSAAGQTRPPRRIFVVDDGSTDNTAEVVVALRLPCLELLRTPSRGASHARNAGFALSRAEFVALLDADDYWRADKLALQAKRAEQSTSAFAIGCSSVQIEPNGRTVLGSFKRFPAGAMAPSPTLENSAFFGGWCSSLLVRTGAWRQLGGFDEILTYAEDADFVLRLAQASALDACDDVLTHIVRNPNSVTRRKMRRESALDDLIAKLIFPEKWLQREPSSSAIAAKYAATIAAGTLARRPSLIAKLAAVRLRMELHTPHLAAVIARSNQELAFNILYFGFSKLLKNASRFGKSPLSPAQHGLSPANLPSTGEQNGL